MNKLSLEQLKAIDSRSTADIEEAFEYECRGEHERISKRKRPKTAPVDQACRSISRLSGARWIRHDRWTSRITPNS
ncbi:hypothetical protein LX32DRAFT_284253 [Colletotrichum zoysiae]|uniref:Uncharacterized protein n=1 Tax=Colletotrichum zoysiae TaxID=1216348 RepID=A0AAD9M6Z9_9PEZI|nr:hypothetical protein LX32DRAFT_284253 [Colletotrichum zoysiae]